MNLNFYNEKVNFIPIKYIFKDFFFDVDNFFKVFIEFVTILLLVLCFGFLSVKHVGS